VSRRAKIVACLAVVGVLSGCSNGTGDTMENSPEASLAAMSELVEQTQIALGGEWEVQDSEVADPCPGGDDARQFLLGRIGPVLDDPDTAETALREVWEPAGLKVERLERPTGVEFLGVGDDRSSVLVSSNPRGTGIQGLSPCFPKSSWDPERQYVTLPPVAPAP